MKKLFALIVIVFAVALVPAKAQVGGIIGRAVQKGVQKAVQKETEKQAERISQTIEAEVEKQAEKQISKMDSVNQAVIAANDSLNSEQERLEANNRQPRTRTPAKRAQAQSILRSTTPSTPNEKQPTPSSPTTNGIINC